MKESIDQIQDKGAKQLALICYERVEANLFNGVDSLEVQLTEEEAETELMRMDTYDIDHPNEYSDYYIYTHTFDTIEKQILRNVLRDSFDSFVNNLTFILPKSVDADSIEFFQYVNSKKTAIDKKPKRTIAKK